MLGLLCFPIPLVLFLIPNSQKFFAAIKKKYFQDLDEPVQKKLKLDTNRTGAKCVKGEIEDPLGSGTEYHNIGVLRRKPGRGDPTLSLSCSDKLLKWNVIGFQVSTFFQSLDSFLVKILKHASKSLN